MFNTVIFGEPSFQPWALTFIHSSCDPALKVEFWEDVEQVGNNFGGPWIILGDFNAVSGQHEKWGERWGR